MTTTQPLWLFDGDCGICATGSARIRRAIGPRVEMAAYQSVDLAALGVDEAAVLDGPVLRMPDGNYFVGPEAMGTMLTLAHQPFHAVGRTMLAPGVRQGLRWLGPRMYRARKYLPGAQTSCAVPAG
jgi:hypothetical protein